MKGGRRMGWKFSTQSRGGRKGDAERGLVKEWVLGKMLYPGDVSPF